MEFIPFFLILFVGVLFSSLSGKFHLPWVIALILSGIALGPYGFGVLETTPVISFMGQIGLVFLMFMAGLETKLSSFKQFRSGIIPLALLNGIIPLAIGFGIGWFAGFGFIAAALLGIIFVSSSVAVIVPSLEANGMLGNRLGRSIVAATVVEDVVSLILLSVLLQTLDPVTDLPLPLFYVLLLGFLVAMRFALPRITKLFVRDIRGRDLFEQEVRIIVAVLIGTVIAFELLGLHSIIAGFFAGLVLSETITSPLLIEKLRTISYGLFIPVFFVIVGLQTDVSVLRGGGSELLLAAFILFGSIGSKFASGWFGARLGGFTKRESTLVGIATTPQLSTTLAVVFTGVALGLLENQLVIAMVLLSMATTLLAPIFLNALSLRR